MRRRLVIGAAGVLAASAALWRRLSAARADAANLLTAPLELTGDWGGSPVPAARIVVTRMREACLAGVRLLSDRQPGRLRVDDHSVGPPHVWLHQKDPDTAWIVVDVGSRDWCRLSYQFGHELGHVMCNSWGWGSKAQLPCQWLEESLVEALSLHSLARLAESWEKDPPFAGNAAYASEIRKYRGFLMHRYEEAGGLTPGAEIAGWFRMTRAALEANNGLARFAGPAILAIVAEMDRNPACAEDLGAVNRWPGRSTVSLEDYLRLWRTSCGEIGAKGQLADHLRAALGIG